MKVLHVINSLATGGAEKLLLESLPIYHAKGIENHLLLLNGKKEPFLNELMQQNCVTIHSLGLGSVYNPLHVIKIISYLKKFKLVHVHIFPSLYWVSIAHALSFSKTKLIYTEHSTTNNRRNNLVFKLTDRFIYSRYSAIVAITQQVLENTLEHLKFKNTNKFFVIQNGLNLTKIKSAKPYSKTEFFSNSDVKIIIQVARFYEPKDPNTIIKALKLLPENVALLLVGDGALKKESEALVHSLNLKKRVLFLGVRNDVLSLLKTADIIVLSSKHEGLSLSCIEGMASGKPFVATNVPGLQEVVKNAGLLFEQGDEKELAEIILKLLSNQEFYHQTTVKCEKKANEYDIFIMVDNYIKIYKELLND